MGVITPIGTLNQSINVDKLAGMARDFGPAIFTNLLNGGEFAAHFPTEVDVVNERSYMKLVVNGNLQPYTGTVNNSGDEVVYSHRKLRVSVGQDSLSVDPEKVRRSAFIDSSIKSAITNGKVYHEAVILAQFLLSLISQLNDSTFYKGDEASTGNNKAIKVADGLEKQLLACIAATDVRDKITPVVTPTWNSGAGWNTVTNEGNVLDGFNALDDSFAPAYKRAERTIFCSHSVFKMYKDNYNRRWNSGLKSERFDGGIFEYIFLEDTNRKVKIAPATWLGSSNRILDIIDGAVRVGTDINEMFSSVDVQKQGFLFLYLIKCVFGVQIVDPEAMRVNSLS